MAEAPPNGLFWFAADEAAARVEFDGDRVVIDGARHGPAGASSVDLPGGDLLQVDHLDPTRLGGGSRWSTWTRPASWASNPT